MVYSYEIIAYMKWKLHNSSYIGYVVTNWAEHPKDYSKQLLNQNIMNLNVDISIAQTKEKWRPKLSEFWTTSNSGQIRKFLLKPILGYSVISQDLTVGCSWNFDMSFMTSFSMTFMIEDFHISTRSGSKLGNKLVAVIFYIIWVVSEKWSDLKIQPLDLAEFLTCSSRLHVLQLSWREDFQIMTGAMTNLIIFGAKISTHVQRDLTKL